MRPYCAVVSWLCSWRLETQDSQFTVAMVLYVRDQLTMPSHHHCAVLQVSVPSVLRLLTPALAHEAAGARLRLRLLVSSGEPLTVALAAALQAAVPSCTVLNLYGEPL